MLRDSDKNNVIEMLKRFDKAYVDLKKTNYVLDDASAYDPQVAYLMIKFLNTLKPITADRVCAHIDNKYHLGFTNVPREIIDTIDGMKANGAKTKQV